MVSSLLLRLINLFFKLLQSPKTPYLESYTEQSAKISEKKNIFKISLPKNIKCALPFIISHIISLKMTQKASFCYLKLDNVKYQMVIFGLPRL